MPLVLEPFALVDAPRLINKHSKTLSLSLLAELSAIYAILVLFDAERSIFPHFFKVKLIADHLVLLDGIALVFKLAFVLARWSKALLEHLIHDCLRHFRVTFQHTLNCLCHYAHSFLCQPGDK